MDVFLSWTGADREVKNLLAEKLEAAGISCWDSDKHCVSNYERECPAAIRQCPVFLVIVSDASMQKGHVKNELKFARDLEDAGKLNILIYKITEAPYTDDVGFLINHISFVTGNLFQRVPQAAGASNLDAVVKRAQTLLQRRRDGEPEKPFEVRVPVVSGMKLTAPGFFVEHSRDRALQELDEGFQRSNVLILTEFFGYGKRSAVRKYVEQYAGGRMSAVMVHNSRETLREFFLSELQFENVNEKRFEELQADALLNEKLKVLQQLDENTLILIPDVHFEENADQTLCEQMKSLRCRFVLLSQETADSYGDWFPVISLGRMDDAHLTELFFHHYTRASEEEQAQLAQPLSEFFAKIGGHTKTVELTAAALNRELGVYPEDIPGYISMDGSEGMQIKDRIIHQIESIFDIDKLKTEELAALLVAAYLAVPYLSERSYRTVLQECGVDDWKVISELDRARWLDVDLQNKTVSIEPLVAQIVLSKFPEEYAVMALCAQYLENRYTGLGVFTTSEHNLNVYFNKLVYFLNASGLPVCAHFADRLRTAVLDQDHADPQALSQALRCFEEACSASQPEDAEEDWEEDWEDETEEPEALPFTREGFVQRVQEFLQQLVPLARVLSTGVFSRLLDYSEWGSSFVQKNAHTPIEINAFEAVLGVSREELTDFLEEYRKSVHEQDEDSLEFFVATETTALTDSLYRRDFTGVTTSLCSLLARIKEFPQLLQAEDLSELICSVFVAVGSMYLRSGMPLPAIMICETFLSHPAPQLNRLPLLRIYTKALRENRQYTPVLYEAYKEHIAILEKYCHMLYENRADMLRDKGEILLFYAADLAYGGSIDEAVEQFDAARKSGNTAPDALADCASGIVDTLINTGFFERAAEFISKYFPRDVQETLLQTGNEQTVQTMNEFALYLDPDNAAGNDFVNDEDPGKYISYYQAYARKNNKLSDRKYLSVAEDALDCDFSHLTDEEITQCAKDLQTRAKKEKLLRLAPEAFALAAEAGFRVLGYRAHLVQYMGAAVMADGKVAEILNGEGKTYTIVLSAFLQSLYGRRVFVVDSSPILTKRNHDWMQGVYALLGVKTQHADKSARFLGTDADVIYTDLKTLVFDFLHYELASDRARGELRPDHAIIDEIDTTLVDGAEQPYLTITQQPDKNTSNWCTLAWQITEGIEDDGTYYTLSKGRVVLKATVYPLLEQTYGVSYTNVSCLETIRQLERILKVAILCRNHYELRKDYFIHRGYPVTEDKDTGIFKSMSATYEYFLCRKNDLDVTRSLDAMRNKSVTTNTICIRDLFKKFGSVCGTTATAASFQKEFKVIYDLDYVAVPPHSECRREDNLPPVFAFEQAKERAIMDLVAEKAQIGQPILLVSGSVEESERYSKLLRRRGIDHRLLNAKNADSCSEIIAQAGIPGSVLVSNTLVGRGADIKLGGDPELKTRRELMELGEDITNLDALIYAVPSAEQKENPLYRKYRSLLDKNRALCAAQRQQVVAAGGLCVIGTSYFPELRTEQQIRGRSGRQGEVGESWMFRSLDDDTFEEVCAPARREQLQSYCDAADIEYVDGAMVQRSIRFAQKVLHDKRFAGIREQTNISGYLDKSRDAFIGRCFDLTDGKVTPDDLLREWASDKQVLAGLQSLQKEDAACDNAALAELWQKYPQLKTAKGSKASEILYDAFRAELEETIRYSEKDHALIVATYICRWYLDAWKDYIEIVSTAFDTSDPEDAAVQAYLKKEKARLLCAPVEKMLQLSLRKSTPLT